MKTRKSIYAAAGFVILAVSGYVFVFAFPLRSPEPPAGVFEKAGYQVLIPQVDKQPPGYFDTVERSTKRSVSLHRTCNIPYDEIEPFIERTRTVDEEITQKLSAGYKADANVLALNGSVNLDGVKQVRVRYENSAIWYLTSESLYNIRKKYLHGTCEAAVEQDLLKGLSVCQTKKVIVSDIVFEVTYESGTKTKIAAASESFSTDGHADNTASYDVHGTKMFHAVKLDEACLKLNPDQSAT